MQYNALFDSRRRDALKGAIASGDIGPMLRRQAEPLIESPTLRASWGRDAGFDIVCTIDVAETMGDVLASSKKICSAIRSGDTGHLNSHLPAWSGTMIGHVEPGRTFREDGEWVDYLNCHAISYSLEGGRFRYLFPIPDQYLDEKDAALAVEHPGFKLEERGNDWIVRAAQVALVSQFPSQDGWYNTDPTLGIPSGAASVRTVPESVFLHREDKFVHLAAVARYTNNEDKAAIALTTKLNVSYGVVVEARKG